MGLTSELRALRSSRPLNERLGMTARREIGKWLNEQPNREVDRVALAELCAEHDAMLEALMQLLDDMSTEGHCVCEAAKQQAMRAAKAHYCPDWDYLPVSPESPEMDGCTCDVPNAQGNKPPSRDDD